MMASRQTPKHIVPTDLRELLHAIRGGQDPLLSVALMAQHVKGLEDAAWNRRAEWEQRSSSGARSEASVQLGRADAFCMILGDQPALSRDIDMLKLEGIDGL